jgi:hypothetical protein
MPETPAPRLGRAVRSLAPVAVVTAAALAAPPLAAGQEAPQGAHDQSASPIVTVPAAEPVDVTAASHGAPRCSSRRQVVISLGSAAAIRPGSARVNGLPAAVRAEDGRLRTTIDLRTLPRGRYTVTTRVVLQDGTVRTGVRRFRTCTPRS